MNRWTKHAAPFLICCALVGGGIMAAPANAQQQVTEPSRAQQLMGDVAPKLADLTDTVLYGDIWERSELSKRDRSLVTVAALVALDRPDQLRSHLRMARQNGVTQAELVETITHLAFYSGWPNSVSAVAIAKEIFAEGTPKAGKP